MILYVLMILRTAAHEKIFCRFFLLSPGTVDVPAFSPVPGAVIFLGNTVCNYQRAFSKTIWSRHINACTRIPRTRKRTKHFICWFWRELVYNELEHYHLYFA